MAEEATSSVDDGGSDIVPASPAAPALPGQQEPIVPAANDVLCGRGGGINEHPGNRIYRNLVDSKKRVYLTARFKREKRLVAEAVVRQIREQHPPGRFLARNGKDGEWHDIGDIKARDKASQALRENAPSIRKEIESENETNKKLRMKEEERENQAQEWRKAHSGGWHEGWGYSPYGPPAAHMMHRQVAPVAAMPSVGANHHQFPPAYHPRQPSPHGHSMPPPPHYSFGPPSHPHHYPQSAGDLHPPPQPSSVSSTNVSNNQIPSSSTMNTSSSAFAQSVAAPSSSPSALAQLHSTDVLPQQSTAAGEASDANIMRTSSDISSKSHFTTSLAFSATPPSAGNVKTSNASKAHQNPVPMSHTKSDISSIFSEFSWPSRKEQANRSSAPSTPSRTRDRSTVPFEATSPSAGLLQIAEQFLNVWDGSSNSATERSNATPKGYTQGKSHSMPNFPIADDEVSEEGQEVELFEIQGMDIDDMPPPSVPQRTASTYRPSRSTSSRLRRNAEAMATSDEEIRSSPEKDSLGADTACHSWFADSIRENLSAGVPTLMPSSTSAPAPPQSPGSKSTGSDGMSLCGGSFGAGSLTNHSVGGLSLVDVFDETSSASGDRSKGSSRSGTRTGLGRGPSSVKRILRTNSAHSSSTRNNNLDSDHSMISKTSSKSVNFAGGSHTGVSLALSASTESALRHTSGDML